MTWRFEPVSRLRCHRPSPIVRASATRVPNALPPDCTNTPPAIGAPGSGAFPVALRAPSNAPDPIKQTAAIRSPDQGHAVPCRRWTPDLCGNRPPLTTVWLSRISMDAHKAKHPEIGVDAYRKIPEILASGQVWRVPGEPERLVFLKVGDVVYRAAVKRTSDGRKNYLLTLFRSTKAKPPKGAVRVR